MANKERLGTIGIFLTALIWGYSFVAVKVVVQEIIEKIKERIYYR